MRVGNVANFVLILAGLAVSAASASAQSTPTAIAATPQVELALGYSFLRSNAPPGGCGCFNLNGGSVQLAWPVKKAGFALAADIIIVNQPAALAADNSLTLGAFMVGTRYRLRQIRGRWQPFAEILAGGGHASGKLIADNSQATQNGSMAFAGKLGGGVDLGLNHRFALRLIEADFFPTTFNNGANNHQNNLFLGTGILVRF